METYSIRRKTPINKELTIIQQKRNQIKKNIIQIELEYYGDHIIAGRYEGLFDPKKK